MASAAPRPPACTRGATSSMSAARISPHYSRTTRPSCVATALPCGDCPNTGTGAFSPRPAPPISRSSLIASTAAPSARCGASCSPRRHCGTTSPASASSPPIRRNACGPTPASRMAIGSCSTSTIRAVASAAIAGATGRRWPTRWPSSRPRTPWARPRRRLLRRSTPRRCSKCTAWPRYMTSKRCSCA